MNKKRFLPVILSGLLPLSVFSESSPAPSPNAGGALTPRPPGGALTVSQPTPQPAANLTPAPDAAELTKLLKDFLAGASRDDAAIHDRFWADDLIYTSALGRRKGKPDILREVHEERPPKPGDETAVYTAEDIHIQQYGGTAIVAFRLVATSDKAGAKTVSYYLNTGTFVKRKGEWQAAGWQATAIPKAPSPTPKP